MATLLIMCVVFRIYYWYLKQKLIRETLYLSYLLISHTHTYTHYPCSILIPFYTYPTPLSLPFLSSYKRGPASLSLPCCTLSLDVRALETPSCTGLCLCHTRRKHFKDTSDYSPHAAVNSSLLSSSFPLLTFTANTFDFHFSFIYKALVFFFTSI